MVRTRSKQMMALFVGALLGMSVVACKKGGAGGAAAAAAASTLPKDAAMVVGLNFDSLKSSKLWGKLSPSFMTDDVKKKLDGIKSACGLDVMSDLKSFVVAQAAGNDPTKMVVLVKGNFDEAKATKCITEAAKADGKTVTITKTGKVSEIKGDDKPGYVFFPESGTAVFGPDKDRINGIADGKLGSVKDNADLSALMGKTDSSATLWIAMVAKDNPMLADMPLGAKPDGVWASITITGGIKANVGIRFAKDDDAKTTADQAKQGLDQAKKGGGPMAGFLDKVTVKQDGKDVIVDAELSESQVDQLSGMMGSMLPQLMGGMMGAQKAPE